MRKTETVKVEEPIKRIFKQYGCYVYKNVQNVFTERGRPDLTACVPVKIKTLIELYGLDAEIGVFVGIECKVNENKYDATEAQNVVGRKIMKAKGLWFKEQDPLVIKLLLERLKVHKEED